MFQTVAHIYHHRVRVDALLLRACVLQRPALTPLSSMLI